MARLPFVFEHADGKEQSFNGTTVDCVRVVGLELVPKRVNALIDLVRNIKVPNIKIGRRRSSEEIVAHVLFSQEELFALVVVRFKGDDGRLGLGRASSNFLWLVETRRCKWERKEWLEYGSTWKDKTEGLLQTYLNALCVI